jgi:hypothetical protein
MKGRHFWILLCVVLLACSAASAQKIITFDAPGAGTGSGQGTFSQGVSDLGITYGYYIDGSGVAHGFLRFPFGGFSSFDAPGAGTAAGQGTFAFSLNPEIALAGYYIDGNGVLHGYVRTLFASITTFDTPGAGTSSGQGTYALNINPEGTVAGYDFDASMVAHGFLRHHDGSFTVFDVPGAGTQPGQGTGSSSGIALNVEGALAGAYIDSANTLRGYLRAPNGAITDIDAPGAGP